MHSPLFSRAFSRSRDYTVRARPSTAVARLWNAEMRRRYERSALAHETRRASPLSGEQAGPIDAGWPHAARRVWTHRPPASALLTRAATHGFVARRSVTR